MDSYFCLFLSFFNHVADNFFNRFRLRRCTSFLVCTGVYKPASSSTEANKSQEKELDSRISAVPVEKKDEKKVEVDHGHRDLPYTEEMTRADHTVYDVKNAIDKIFKIENWIPR